MNVPAQDVIDPVVRIDERVQFLKRPEAYPDRPGNVEAIETHMAWVFLAGAHAY